MLIALLGCIYTYRHMELKVLATPFRDAITQRETCIQITKRVYFLNSHGDAEFTQDAETHQHIQPIFILEPAPAWFYYSFSSVVKAHNLSTILVNWHKNTQLLEGMCHPYFKKKKKKHLLI